MRVREYQQEYQDDLGTSGTVTYPLDFSDPITEIGLLFEATNGATSNKDNPIDRNISKIEIVDGGEVLWSCPGDVALGVVAQMRGALPHCYRTGAISDSPYQNIPLQFGRYPFDPEYAFNPTAHRNPQLKVTFDEATVRAAGATGFVSDSFLLSVNVRLMEEASPPTAFLSMREVETFTSLASGDRVVRLPSDRVIRAIVNRAYESGTDMRSSISNLKLSADGGKFIPFDLRSGTLVDMMCEAFKPLLVPQYTVADNGEVHQTWVAIDLEAFIRDHTGSYIVGGASSWPGQMTVRLYTHAGVASTAKPVHFGVIGWGINNCLIYPFGRADEPEDWYNPTGLQNLDLVLTQADEGAEVNVCLQQVYQY